MTGSAIGPTTRVEDLRVDEAEYRVGAFVPPSRIGRPWSLAKGPLDLPVFRAAAQRMRDRGLANDDAWVQDSFPGTLCPQGAWRDFIGHTERFTGTSPRVTIHDADAGSDVQLRIIPATDLPHTGTADGVVTSERVLVPRDADDSPLPVDIRWRPLGQVLDDVMDEVGRVRNGTFTVRAGADFTDGETVTIVDNVARAILPVGWFGRNRTVQIGGDRLRRVMHDVMTESVGVPR